MISAWLSYQSLTRDHYPELSIALTTVAVFLSAIELCVRFRGQNEGRSSR